MTDMRLDEFLTGGNQQAATTMTPPRGVRLDEFLGGPAPLPQGSSWKPGMDVRTADIGPVPSARPVPMPTPSGGRQGIDWQLNADQQAQREAQAQVDAGRYNQRDMIAAYGIDAASVSPEAQKAIGTLRPAVLALERVGTRAKAAKWYGNAESYVGSDDIDKIKGAMGQAESQGVNEALADRLEKSTNPDDRQVAQYVRAANKVLRGATTNEGIILAARALDTLLAGIPTTAYAGVTGEELIPTPLPTQRTAASAGSLLGFMGGASTPAVASVNPAIRAFSAGSKFFRELPGVARLVEKASTMTGVGGRLARGALEVPAMQAGMIAQEALWPVGEDMALAVREGRPVDEVYAERVLSAAKPSPEGVVMGLAFGFLAKARGKPDAKAFMDLLDGRGIKDVSQADATEILNQAKAARDQLRAAQATAETVLNTGKVPGNVRRGATAAELDAMIAANLEAGRQAPPAPPARQEPSRQTPVASPEVASGAEPDTGKSPRDMAPAELVNFAESLGIDPQGTREDIIQAVEAAQARGAKPAEVPQAAPAQAAGVSDPSGQFGRVDPIAFLYKMDRAGSVKLFAKTNNLPLDVAEKIMADAEARVGKPTEEGKVQTISGALQNALQDYLFPKGEPDQPGRKVSIFAEEKSPAAAAPAEAPKPAPPPTPPEDPAIAAARERLKPFRANYPSEKWFEQAVREEADRAKAPPAPERDRLKGEAVANMGLRPEEAEGILSVYDSILRTAQAEGKVSNPEEFYRQLTVERATGERAAAAGARQGDRAWIDFEGGRGVIRSLAKADVSSLAHEMLHFSRSMLEEWFPKDMAAVRKFLGVKEGQKWARDHEERFARAFERYLREGYVPGKTPLALKGVFERLKSWLAAIYRSLTSGKLDAKGLGLTEGQLTTIRRIFDRMLGSTQPLDRAMREGELIDSRNKAAAQKRALSPQVNELVKRYADTTAAERAEAESTAMARASGTDLSQSRNWSRGGLLSNLGDELRSEMRAEGRKDATAEAVIRFAEDRYGIKIGSGTGEEVFSTFGNGREYLDFLNGKEKAQAREEDMAQAEQGAMFSGDYEAVATIQLYRELLGNADVPFEDVQAAIRDRKAQVEVEAGSGELPPFQGPVNAEGTLSQGRPEDRFELTPEAKPTSPDELVGVKNAYTEARRKALGMEGRAPVERRHDLRVMEEAQARMNANPEAGRELVDSIIKDPARMTTDADQALLDMRLVQYENRLDAAVQAVEEARKSGDVSAVENAQGVADAVRSELDMAYSASELSGTQLGRGLGFRRVMLNRDFSLGRMERDARLAKGAELTAADREEVRKAHEKIKSITGELEAEKARREKTESELNFANELLRLRRRMKGEEAVKLSRAGLDTVRRAVPKARREAFDTNLAKLVILTAKRGPLMQSAANVESIHDLLSEVAADSIAAKVKDFAEWKNIVRQANVHATEGELAAAWEEGTQRHRVRRRAEIAQRAGERVKKSSDPTDIGQAAQQIAREFIADGITQREPLLDAVHGTLKQYVPDITRRQTMDAISGYGDYRQLSKDAVSVTLRDLKGQMQQIGKLEDMAAGQAPRKTGPERRTPSDEERRLLKFVEEAKRKGGFDVLDPETQLRTALQSVKTRWANELRDMERQLATGKQDVPDRTPLELDAEANSLKARRDDLREMYNEVFGNKLLTPEQRLERWKKRAEGKIAEYEQRTAEGDFQARKRAEPPPLDAAGLDMQYRLDKAKKEWAEKRYEWELQQRNKLRKVWDFAKEALSLSRTLKASTDVSAVLRQGVFFAFGHPLRTLRAMRDMFRAGFSEKQQFAIEEAIRRDPSYQQSRKDGLELTGHNMALNRMEELFAGRWIGKLPKWTGAGPVLRFSERTYTTFLNSLRFQMYKVLRATLARSAAATAAEGRAVANLINVATGRAPMGKMQGAVDGFGRILFAPRFAISRFQLLIGQPFWGGGAKANYGGSWRARRMIAIEYARFLTGAAVVLGLAKLAGASINVTDPESPDFLKAKWGNTRLDVLGGLQQATTFLARLMPDGFKKYTWGSDAKRDDWDTITRFVRGKLAPIPATSINLLQGKNLVEEPVTAGGTARDLLAPMGLVDAYEVMKEQGVPAGTAFTVLTAFGFGLNTYQDKTPTRSGRTWTPPTTPTFGTGHN